LGLFSQFCFCHKILQRVNSIIWAHCWSIHRPPSIPNLLNTWRYNLISSVSNEDTTNVHSTLFLSRQTLQEVDHHYSPGQLSQVGLSRSLQPQGYT
jgi:hypothetical protein